MLSSIYIFKATGELPPLRWFLLCKQIPEPGELPAHAEGCGSHGASSQAGAVVPLGSYRDEGLHRLWFLYYQFLVMR